MVKRNRLGVHFFVVENAVPRFATAVLLFPRVYSMFSFSFRDLKCENVLLDENMDAKLTGKVLSILVNGKVQ